MTKQLKIGWYRDPDSVGMPHGDWFFGPKGEIDEAIISVHPDWGATRGTGHGPPTRYLIHFHGPNLKSIWAPTLAQAKKAALEQLEVLDKNTKYRETLQKHGIAAPAEGLIADARWVAGRDDWYVYINRQWFWWDKGAATWKRTQYEP